MPFNTITYDLIGDDSAPSYFTLNRENGAIKVKEQANLAADTEISYVVSDLCFISTEMSLSVRMD